MKLCVRLAVLSALLVALAIGLVNVRTGTHQAGNRLHALFSEKRDLEKACCRLELAIAQLKNQQRLREQAEAFRERMAAEAPEEASPPGASLIHRPGRMPP
jgi:cell division protein FtsL